MTERFEVFPHMKHAAKHPPNALIMERWRKAILDKSSPEFWGRFRYMHAPERTAAYETIAHWIKTWLKTLPDHATVSARQLLEVFVPDYEDHGTGRDAEDAFKRWASVMSSVRHQGFLDGWWTPSAKLNHFGRPYINHHNERKLP